MKEKGLFEKKIQFQTAFFIIKRLKQIKYKSLLVKCAPVSELTSNITIPCSSYTFIFYCLYVHSRIFFLIFGINSPNFFFCLVLDKNDNPPEFRGKPYVFSVPETEVNPLIIYFRLCIDNFIMVIGECCRLLTSCARIF